jgi:TrmH family RNA methyltransferase
MITSRQNPKIQTIRNLLTRKRERDESGLMVIEGIRLIEEAYKSGCIPVQVYFCRELTERGNALLGQLTQSTKHVDELSQSVMDYITETETSQGIVAVFPKPTSQIPEKFTLLLIIDNIRDPGNLGTMFRTALAAGVDAILVSPGSTEIYSPKTLRSAMGAHFHIPIMDADWATIKSVCARRSDVPLRVIMADSNNGISYWEEDLKSPLALIISNEAEGPSIEARNICDSSILIPMSDKSESLNAAVAAGIILFEIVRQRQK